jgi:hypothetical protein
MANLRLGLLGSFRLETSTGAPVFLPTKRAKALLAYLALHQGKPQARSKLALFRRAAELVDRSFAGKSRLNRTNDVLWPAFSPFSAWRWALLCAPMAGQLDQNWLLEQAPAAARHRVRKQRSRLRRVLIDWAQCPLRSETKLNTKWRDVPTRPSAQ